MYNISDIIIDNKQVTNLWQEYAASHAKNTSVEAQEMAYKVNSVGYRSLLQYKMSLRKLC